MNDFTFVTPTKINFGKNAEDKLADVLNEFGFKRVFLLHGCGSIKKIGLYDKIIKILKSGFVYEEVSGVRANRHGQKPPVCFRPSWIWRTTS